MVLKFRSFAILAIAASFGLSTQAEAQNAVLAEMYGRGVHAYYSGNQTEAYHLLSMAINNGSQDPRAYYFRGIVADASGRSYEAESDWQRGAELEAAGGNNPAIGRALARFQGSTRLKLEEVRQKARLQALALAAARSQARYGEINAAQPVAPIVPPAAPAVQTPPAAPDTENPFSAVQGGLATGDPKVESDDALDGAMDPFSDDAPPVAGGSDLGGADPFAAPASGGDAPRADPFATPPADAGGAPADDPFAPAAGGDPFAPAADSGGAAMDDPFATGGDDPFAN